MAADTVITASAPGSLMLLGEHAVLHGKRALVCAISRRIHVSLHPEPDSAVKIISALGTYESTLEELSDDAAFRFLIQVFRQHCGDVPSGFRLEVESEFSADIGFGSSAAVTVAAHAALMRWVSGKAPEKKLLFEQALKTVHAVQGRGSGADLAAAVFGGVVAYSTAPDFRAVPVSLPLTAVYCGYKTPTPEVIRRVELLRSEDPEKYDRIYFEMDKSVESAVIALQNNDMSTFGKILNRNQILMEQMGVCTEELAEIVGALQQHASVCGAKISGSGMGDCAIGIGHAELPDLSYPVYHLSITPQGCEC